jgi:hypothetical protein
MGAVLHCKGGPPCAPPVPVGWPWSFPVGRGCANPRGAEHESGPDLQVNGSPDFFLEFDWKDRIPRCLARFRARFQLKRALDSFDLFGRTSCLGNQSSCKCGGQPRGVGRESRPASEFQFLPNSEIRGWACVTRSTSAYRATSRLSPPPPRQKGNLSCGCVT